MDFYENHSPVHFYIRYLASIGDIKFTRREMDILAYLLNGRSAKKIALALSISPRTVETHYRNIMQKLDCNSREGILDFIENSGKLTLIHQYHLLLLQQGAFEKELKEIHRQLNAGQSKCLIICQSEALSASPFMTLLKDGLKRIGLKLTIHIPTQSESNNAKLPSGDFVIYIAAYNETSPQHEKVELELLPLVDRLVKIQNASFIAICNAEKRTMPSGLVSCLDESNFFNIKEYQHPYFVIFNIIKYFFPSININTHVHNFEKQYVIFKGGTAQPALNTMDVNYLDTSEYSVINIFKKSLRLHAYQAMIFLVALICVLCIITINIYYDKPIFSQFISSNTYIARPDFIMPNDNTLLERSSLLNAIKEKLDNSQKIQTVAIVGVGGSGKTTIARQYLISQDARIIWEFNAGTKETLLNSLEAFAGALSKTDNERKKFKEIITINNLIEKETKLIELIQNFLKLHPHWLLIYDNVEKFGDIQKAFPIDSQIWGVGKVIITTRNRNIKDNDYINSIIDIQELSNAEKFQIFKYILSKNFTKEQITEAENFLKELPPYPLDISVAAYYLKRTNVTYAKYLEYIKQQEQDFVSIQSNMIDDITGYGRTRYSIVTLALNKVLEANVVFGDLMLLISLIDSQDIPRDMLTRYKNDLIVDNFIYHLNKYSLINPQPSSYQINSTISVHNSTQSICLVYLMKLLDVNQSNERIKTFIKAIEKYADYVIEKEDYNKINLCKMHWVILKNNLDARNIYFEEPFFRILGILEYYLGNYKEAVSSLKQCLPYINREPKENAKKAKIFYHLGSAYRELGQLDDARTYLESSLNIYKGKYPEKIIEISQTKEELGNVYRNLGNYETSKNLLESCLALYEQDPSNNQRRIARTLTYLGTIYRELGYLNDARLQFERSIYLYENSPIINHMGIARALTYLGTVYRELGEFYKAKTHFERSLNLYLKYFSEKQLGAARALTYLGVIHRELGSLKEAIDFLNRSITNYATYFSKDHLGVARSLVYLATVYREEGKFDKATRSIEESLAIYKRNSPHDIEDTAWALGHLGNIKREMGNYEEAGTYLKKSFLIYQRFFKEDSVDVAWIMQHLAKLYLDQGHLEEAKGLLEKSLKSLEKTSPENKLKIANISSYLGLVNARLKNFSAAQELCGNSLKIYEQLYGISHIETAKLMYNLGYVYLYSGQHNLSLTCFHNALETFKNNKHYYQYKVLEGLADYYIESAHQTNKQTFYRNALDNLSQAIIIANSHLSEKSQIVVRLKQKVEKLQQYNH